MEPIRGLFYVADVEADGPAMDGELHVDLEVADFLLLFPLREKGRVRLVGVVRELPGREAGSLAFDDVRGRAVEHLGLEVRKINWFSTYRVHHRVAQRFRDGRVFLLGDAAHIHSPVGGQGMNTGIGDAVNLAWKLAAVLKHGAAERLLDSYAAERMPFARRLVATTDRMFTLVTAPGRVAAFVRTRVVPRVAPVLLRLAPLRRFLFRTLSQIGIQYRDSPLSDGVAGGLRGGDRLPWIELAPARTTSPRSLRLPGRCMRTAGCLPGSPRSAPRRGCRCTRSNGSRRCRHRAFARVASTSFGRMDTWASWTAAEMANGCGPILQNVAGSFPAQLA